MGNYIYLLRELQPPPPDPQSRTPWVATSVDGVAAELASETWTSNRGELSAYVIVDVAVAVAAHAPVRSGLMTHHKLRA